MRPEGNVSQRQPRKRKKPLTGVAHKNPFGIVSLGEEDEDHETIHDRVELSELLGDDRIRHDGDYDG